MMQQQTFINDNTSIAITKITAINPTNSIIRPFFQWLGGKRKIVDKLIERIPLGLNNYYEPFLGGGALFFQIKNIFNKCFLSDINLELVTSYNAVKKNPAKIIELCESYRLKHNKEYYNQVRDNNINSNDPTEITARFLYLNRYSFRGIYRVNKHNQILMSCSSRNYANSDNFITTLNQCSSTLQDTTIYAGDFSFIEPQANDFVYFDPPYHKSGECFYTRVPFGEDDQVRLKIFAMELSNKGIKLMISNSDTSFIRELYKDFNISTITIKYSISNYRRTSNEVLITNY
ncbi:DNA adenine methylase [Candidatus Tisiphia endosymbiont of Oplodontha viridula]|uniref:DNA adenine methylase n=1 Tax=Candidatus Tisiphia endosymbiont of Oplodontha viridula TaxID=3077925 RepID=UPI0035C8D4A2